MSTDNPSTPSGTSSNPVPKCTPVADVIIIPPRTLYLAVVGAAVAGALLVALGFTLGALSKD